MCILKCFEEVSRLRVNYNKSKLYGIGVNEGDMSDMARWMGCDIGEFSFTYLGLPIGENMRRVSAWTLMVEKFIKRLADWKAKTMSFGGRLTLVKSVFGSLPLYYFSMFRVPLSVMKNLESIRKNFFCGGSGGGNKLSWVKWGSVLSSFWGGLNIGSLRAKNLALLVFHGEYGVWGDIRALGEGVTRGGVWGDIMKAGREIDGLGWISLLLVWGFWEMGEILDGKKDVSVLEKEVGVDNRIDGDRRLILEYSFQQGSSFECHVPSDVGQFLLFELWSTVSGTVASFLLELWSAASDIVASSSTSCL
ncbi:hypothetical protein Tco_1354741 [Tanacetum coccineum]